MTHSKNIAIFHYQVGGTDGVSLEINKWKRVLEEMGHSVFLCAGDLGGAQGTLIRQMYHHLPEAERLFRNTFIRLAEYDAQSYRKAMEQQKEVLVSLLSKFIIDKRIDTIISQNIWSIAANPPLSMALAEILHRFGLHSIAHHHDFYWERYGGVALTCAAAIDLADEYLPPRNPLVEHVVINSLAQQALMAHKGINSTVVPNVFDFDGSTWTIEPYNADLRRRIGLRENDLMILQATRIVPRKGIELAIDFVRALNAPERRARLGRGLLYNGRQFDAESRIVLVVAGYSQDDLTHHYKANLARKAQEAGVDILFIEDWISGTRGTKRGRKTYALWDVYPFADLVTYPSLWEGWGNQFLEALYAKVPVVLFEYPVYQKDIAPRDFGVISLGSQIIGRDSAGLVRVSPDIINAAADKALIYLTNPEYRKEIVERNYRVARVYYSLATLHTYLEGLLKH